MIYFGQFWLIFADYYLKRQNIPPCARMYRYNYINLHVALILLHFFTFLIVVPNSKWPQ